VTPPGLHSFFATSAGVAGALIGLLFVAISVAHDRLSAEDAAQTHRVRASAALTAFMNALTVSLFALLSGEEIGGATFVVAILGLIFVLASLLSLRRVRRTQPGELRDALFLVGLVVIFALQLIWGLLVLEHPHHAGNVRAIAILVIVCFLVGIARSWELIGGPSIALHKEVAAIVKAHADDAREGTGDH
jgi:uncharacterized membrane protein YecN with MAPEG domain